MRGGGGRRIIYKHVDLERPTFVRSATLITTVWVIEGPGHDELHVWNRGGKAGTLTVNKGDGERIAQRLVGPESTREEDKDYAAR